MNYWLVTTEYPPQSGGGISTYCYHTGQMLCAHGHKVFVFIPDSNIKQELNEVDDNGVTLIYFPIQHYDHLGYEAGLSYTISQVLRSYCINHSPPDVIEFQEYNGIGYYTLQRKWLEKDYFSETKFLVTAHAPSYLYLEYNQAPGYSFPEFWIGEMEKHSLKTADVVISPSQYLLNKLELDDDKSHVVFNPYQIDSTTLDDIQIGDVAFFGKLTPQKGALEMLSYFENAWRSGEKISLNVIGGGDHFFYPLLKDVGDYVRDKYSNRIDEGLLTFEGHIKPNLLPQRIAKAHVIIVPSIVDNLPYTVVEAMSLGKIVLASTDGGHKELIEHGVSGFLFDHRLKNDFIHTLKGILALNTSEIAAIGIAAKKSISLKCGYDHVYEKKIKLLQSNPNSTNHLFPFLRPEVKPPISDAPNSESTLLSVVIPYYNMGKFVNECIDSVTQSEYSSYEIIVVNDGSTDAGSIEALKKLQLNDRIKIYNKDNSGLSATRNFGALKAKGEYIAFLDPDDSVEPTYYNKAIHILKTYSNVSFIGCWAKYFGAKNYIWPSFNPEPPYLLTHNMVNSSAIVIRRNDYLHYGQNDEAFIYGMEDYDSIINLVKNGCGGVIIPECLWNYRIRKGSLAQSFNKYSKQYLYKLLVNKHGDYYQKYATEVINLLNANGPGMNFDNPTKKLGIFHGLNLPFNNSKLIETLKGNKFLRKIAKSIYSHIGN